jgi:sucrose 6(F)-phosphate phosphorylase
VEPEIFEFLDWMKQLADSVGIELLPEIHSHHAIQDKLSERGFWIYDFILPYRILEALSLKRGTALSHYLAVRPSRQFTMLDCHDGIPVKPDLDGLVDSSDAAALVRLCLERGANLSRIVSDRHKDADGFDVHQIRGTIYSLLGEDDDACLAARAIQFFTPGIPQVYYVGLLAGANDEEAVRLTGEGRELNRHNYSREEIGDAIQKPVVKRLLQLIRFRNGHPAFDGQFGLEASTDSEIRMTWKHGTHSCRLHVDLETRKTEIVHTGGDGEACLYLV